MIDREYRIARARERLANKAVGEAQAGFDEVNRKHGDTTPEYAVAYNALWAALKVHEAAVRVTSEMREKMRASS